MNLLHLKYAVEVSKCRSISEAAGRLFMGQPNLSRAIKELEREIGITIFKRTPKGIVPTPQGEEFLARAEQVVLQLSEMEMLYGKAQKDRLSLRVSVPRASYIGMAFTRFVAGLDPQKGMELDYKETNSMRAITNLTQGNYRLAIVRYDETFADNFCTMFEEKNLHAEDIYTFCPVAILHKSNPLAKKPHLGLNDLSDGVQIVHGDPYIPFLPSYEARRAELPTEKQRRILIYERESQFSLLEQIPGAYLCAAPLPQVLLARHSLVQRKCEGLEKRYRDVLLYKHGYRLTDMDRGFLAEIRNIIPEIAPAD